MILEAQDCGVAFDKGEGRGKSLINVAAATGVITLKEGTDYYIEKDGKARFVNGTPSPEIAQPAPAQPAPPQGTPAQQAVPPQTPVRENPAQVAEEEPDTSGQRKHPYVRNLTDGNHKRDVRRLQVWLAELGYLQPIDIIQERSDGDFGQRTESALKRFQSAAGLPTTGTVDEKTWNTLQDKYYDVTNADDKKYNDVKLTAIARNPLDDFDHEKGCISEFGKRKGDASKGISENHRGIDLISNKRTVYASMKGTVVFISEHVGSRGRVVMIQSESDHPIRIYTIAQHLSAIDERLIKAAEKNEKIHVEPGDSIGIMGGSGSKGENSYGIHLHYETNVRDPRTSETELGSSLYIAINPWRLLP
jgi:murein DD-endopeptidase MepM/ murein hydrolase activator NlpD